MNCENCEIEINFDHNAITCESCGGHFCPDHVKETELGMVCIDDIELLNLEVTEDG